MTTPVNKSEFIRRYPNYKPAQIVALAAKEGFHVSPGIVYTVRANANRKLAEATARSQTKPAPVAVRRASKASIINQYPDLSPEQVVKELARMGVQVSAGYVRMVREDANRRNLIERLGEELAETQTGDIATGHQEGVLEDILAYAAKVATADLL